MPHDHAHASGATSERRLWCAFGLTGSFMVLEAAGGLLLNSLALLSDAAHMFTDVTALGIALAAIRVGRRPTDDRRSFGYQRFEIVADPRVERVHDLHVWSLTSGRHVLTAHVVTRTEVDGEVLLLALTPLLKQRFDLFHTTLQVERTPCADLHASAPATQPHADGHPPERAH